MINKWHTAGQAIWHDQDLLPQAGPESFAVDHWRALGAAVTGSAGGRSTAWFIEHDGLALLLRHYYRGGFIARFNRDLFLGRRVARSRAMREFSLLRQMRELGLPVPRPVAARMLPCLGLWYRADIIVETVPDSSDLFRILCQQALPAEQWREVGRIIRQVHDAGVWHADLNCHNILLDAAGAVWIVDFDRCEFRDQGPWREANLARLRRSLLKESGKHAPFHWDNDDWESLLAGYHGKADGQDVSHNDKVAPGKVVGG